MTKQNQLQKNLPINNLISSFPDSQSKSLVKLWMLRILVPLNGYREFINSFSIDFDIAEFLKLKTVNKSDDLELKSIRKELYTLYYSTETKAQKYKAPKCLTQNIQKLASLLGLSEVDCRILEFAVILQNEELLSSATNFLSGNLTSNKVMRILSVLLEIPERQINQSLGVNAPLTNSGLLVIHQLRNDSLSQKLAPISRSFADTIYSLDTNPISLLKESILISTAPHLELNDYDHINKEISVLNLYLNKSLTTNRMGVNAYIHGEPGTGKTQLVKVLAKALGTDLFEVASEDENGNPIKPIERLRAFRAAQSILRKRKAIILFDEVEDIFDNGVWGSKSTAQTHKAWFNRLLENNSVPTIWLSNSISNVDSAFLRRYDMIFELPIPPRKQRKKIIKNICFKLLDEQSIDRVSTSENLSPAVITRAASVIQSIQSELGQTSAPAAFELIVNNTLTTQGHKPIQANDPNGLPKTYDPKCINADTNISEIAKGLKETKSGRLCIYGPPGTGKTAYGRWLSEQLEIPLLVKRGSDMISKWLGGSEKNIARAFKEAEEDGALLLIDEVEGFLQDRRGAQRSWEVTAVNEMLTQMESFSGVFMASTNLLDSLDQAALRRFDLKMKFDFLLPGQSWRLLKNYCNELNLSSPNSNLKRSLDRFTNITPGDFAAIKRQHKFKPIKSAQEIINALDYECKLKNDSKQAIGFI